MKIEDIKALIPHSPSLVEGWHRPRLSIVVPAFNEWGAGGLSPAARRRAGRSGYGRRNPLFGPALPAPRFTRNRGWPVRLPR